MRGQPRWGETQPRSCSVLRIFQQRDAPAKARQQLCRFNAAKSRSTLLGCGRCAGAAPGRAPSRAQPPSARCPRAEPCRGAGPQGHDGLLASSLVSPERVPHGDRLPQRGQHLVPVRDAHPAGRRANEDMACVVGAAVLTALSHRHPQGQVLWGSTRPSQQSSTERSLHQPPHRYRSPFPLQPDTHANAPPSTNPRIHIPYDPHPINTCPPK